MGGTVGSLGVRGRMWSPGTDRKEGGGIFNTGPATRVNVIKHAILLADDGATRRMKTPPRNSMQ